MAAAGLVQAFVGVRVVPSLIGSVGFVVVPELARRGHTRVLWVGLGVVLAVVLLQMWSFTPAAH